MSSNKINITLNENKLEPLYWVLPNKKEFIQWVNQTFYKYRATGKKTEIKKNFEPFNYQKLLRDYMQNNSPYRGILLYHGLGSGKCHARDTKILMHNGYYKLVQDIVVGDLLMGDDSLPRCVLSLATGTDVMYQIVGDNYSYTVNSEHILCLKDIRVQGDDNNHIVEIEVHKYLLLPDSEKEFLKGYRCAVEFPEKETQIDPYKYGFGLDFKEIHESYIINSRQKRLELLAGMIDRNYKFYINKYILKISNIKNLYKIIFLCRSLGIHVDIKNKININGDFYYLPICGGVLNEINLQKNNNILEYSNNDKKDYSLYDITVIKKREDEYYGFIIDGNHRYLLEDFTCTHNTCSAITISENLKEERNVVVLLPASLRTNFIYDGLMFCGDDSYKTSPELYKDKYTFISYNANNTLTQLKRIGNLDNKVIIIEEVHNLLSKIMSGIYGISKQGKEIYDYLMNAQNAKIVAMSGTPVINDPFELAILFNILRGYIEITYFRIASVADVYGETWEFKALEEKLLREVKYIDYIETNKINKSMEFHLTIKSYSEDYRDTIDKIMAICAQAGIIIKFLENKLFELFPTDGEGELFHNYFIKDAEEGDKLKNDDVFRRRILGLVSYYKPAFDENYPTVIDKGIYRVEMSNYQYQIYEFLRRKERKSERGSGEKGKKKRGGVKSTFRVFSRQVSNFVFPDDIYRPYPDPAFIVSLKTKNNENNPKKIEKLLQLEEVANNEGKMTLDYKNRIDAAIKLLVENGDVYFREELDKLSPKMKTILENVNKSPGLVFIYSNFRTLEGVELFSKVLDFNGYSKFNPKEVNKKTSGPKYAIYSGTEDEEEKKQILRVFTSNDNKYGDKIKIIMVTSAGAEGLDLKNIRQIHIMEPYWNQMRIEQVIGRGVRRNSHAALKPNERNVEVYKYFSVFSPKNALMATEKLSTDEYIHQISLKKQSIINEVIEILKECAFDCALNSPDIKGDYKCMTFGSNATGFSYLPSLSQDFVKSRTKDEKRVEKVNLTKGVYFEGLVYLPNSEKKIFYLYRDSTNQKSVKVDLKKSIMILINPKTDEVFDLKSAKNGNPIRLGYINNLSKIVKKR
jgi:superfamily II DNA or RNA helicase